MSYKNILTISGKSGLFKLVSQSKNKAIVESITEHTCTPLFMSHKASSLEEIYLFTNEGTLPVKDVLKRINTYAQGGKAIDHKAPETEIRKYMENVIPEYDREKVHFSDMKRLFMWYNLLHDNNLLELEEEEKTEVEEKVEKKAGKEKTEKKSEE